MLLGHFHLATIPAYSIQATVFVSLSPGLNPFNLRGKSHRRDSTAPFKAVFVVVVAKHGSCKMENLPLNII